MTRIPILAVGLAFALAAHAAPPTPAEVQQRLKGFDAVMEKTLKDWNAPGVGVAIVVGDQVILSKGYGYRDVEKKLPFTPETRCQIASNTKLFTAVAAGLLVEEGKLTWDQPVRDSVPAIRFHNDALNAQVTLRDMLGHRTGVTRHDTIWYKGDFTRKELFDRLRLLEPKEPLRQTFLYNNLMYAGAGYLIELQSGQSWETFVQKRMLDPLGMASTTFSIAEAQKRGEMGVPFTERRDSDALYRLPYYEDIAGVAPCGAMVSNLQDMSRWLIALMNDGKLEGKQVLPPRVLKATLEPAIALPNSGGESRGWWEILNQAYGMGRQTASYRGHLMTQHGGDLPGFHSQVAYLPQDKIGVVVLVIGDHCAPLYNTISYQVFERLLGLSPTPWSERRLAIYQKGKEAGKVARGKAGAGQVANAKPSHPLEDYAGTFDHPAYGPLKIALKEGQLHFDFHKIRMPMTHFHYDRFDTADDEQDGKFSVNFLTSPQGDIDRAVMSLDEAEATFLRVPETLEPALLQRLAGTYETPTGGRFQVVLKADGSLWLAFPGAPEQRLLPSRGLKFRVQEFSDQVFEFVLEKDVVKALKQIDPSGEFLMPRR